jgi:hypothetical protein
MKKLSEGAKVEMEHAKDWGRIKQTKSPEEMAGIIASAHTNEFPGYYPALAKMENSLKKRGLETKRNKSAREKYGKIEDKRKERLGK